MASIFVKSPVLYFVVVVVVLLCGGHAHGEGKAVTVYDVTEYGAAPSNRDNKDAFLAAWRAACDSTAGNATLHFPKGTFAVGAVEFEGPCRNGGAPAVVIDGVLQPCAGCRLSSDAWITFSGLNNLLVTGDGGTLDGQGAGSDDDKVKSKSKTTTTTLVFDGVTNSTLRGLAFVNSRGFHVNIRRSSRVVAEGLGIHAPAHSRNTDGVHVGLSSHIRVLDSVIGTGDDCVSVGPGSVDVVVDGVICGPGHGLSVGSLGKEEGEEDVQGLIIKNCTVKGTTNGVRIKTWPGSPPSRASNITFQDITMDGVANPIIIDQRYCPHDHCADANKPSEVQISDVTFERIEGTSSSRVAVRLLCSEERPCTGVRLDGINLSCGDQPCRSVLSNVRETPDSGSVVAPVPVPAPAPSPVSAPAARPPVEAFAVAR
ncbi:hypothetical protein BDA96_07G192400 [Sorghum bicolor]|uniref:Exopolygalacturonase n=1 Tax=Sorghum bicolor TaxID=4558 RepID=A0A921QP11_SORBI|nr:exopolygalacturonase [Sorghum bicolor]KAG0524227.1 hypothetical protein BDA96_07G192400 [Sorghum bicolor]|eukprot:XP_021321502.1 exopolygalacturonase [Sorghum bicolor]